jgi:hypothetical protein
MYHHNPTMLLYAPLRTAIYTDSRRLDPRTSRWMAGSALLEEPSPTEETTLRKINIGGSARWR